MHRSEFVLENEMHKILWNFTNQMDHPILKIQIDHLVF